MVPLANEGLVKRLLLVEPHRPAPQASPKAQLPQELTVRLIPQLSEPVTGPQFLASREQKAASLSGEQVALAITATRSGTT